MLTPLETEADVFELDRGKAMTALLQDKKRCV